MGLMATHELAGIGLAPPASYYAARYTDPAGDPLVRGYGAAVPEFQPPHFAFPSLPAGYDSRTAWSWYPEWAELTWQQPGNELFGMGGDSGSWFFRPLPLLGAAIAFYTLLPKGAPTPRMANPGPAIRKVKKILGLGRKKRRRRSGRRRRR